MERHFRMKDRPSEGRGAGRRGRGGQPYDSGDTDRDRGRTSNAVRVGADGALHEPDADRGEPRDDVLASSSRSSAPRGWRSACSARRTTAKAETSSYVLEETRIYRAYRWLLEPLLEKPAGWLVALAVVVAVLLLGATGLFFTRTVMVKMLPFDDKNEMQVILDLPEGTTLETSAALALDVARGLEAVPEIEDVQVYAGVAAPFNFQRNDPTLLSASGK